MEMYTIQDHDVQKESVCSLCIWAIINNLGNNDIYVKVIIDESMHQPPVPS